MNEFFRIAEEQDMLGLKKTAMPEKNPHQEDLKTIEEKRLKSPEKSIIEEAHPEPVYVAEARGDGGLVENQIEQQKKLIEMLNKIPTGSLVGRYASTAIELVKMANACDDIGEENSADILTDVATQLFILAQDDNESDMAELFDLFGINEPGESDKSECDRCGGAECARVMVPEGECSYADDVTAPLEEAPFDL